MTLKRKKSRKRNSGVGAFHARMSALPEGGRVSKEKKAGCGGRGTNSSKRVSRSGCSSKTSPDSSQAMAGRILRLSYAPLPKSKFLCLDMESGQTQDLFGEREWRSLGGSSMLNTSDSPNDVAVCLLSDILEREVLQKYFLSAKACVGILRRSEKRGTKLPQALRVALIMVVHSQLQSQQEQLRPTKDKTEETIQDRHILSEPLSIDTMEVLALEEEVQSYLDLWQDKEQKQGASDTKKNSVQHSKQTKAGRTGRRTSASPKTSGEKSALQMLAPNFLWEEENQDKDMGPLLIAPTLSTKNEVASSSTQRLKWYEQAAKIFGRPRRLTPMECERLQGYEDGFTLLIALDTKLLEMQ